MKTINFARQTKRLMVGSLCATGLQIIPHVAYAAGYSGPNITFEQVYAEPDNERLNLNYARQQAAKGDFISAAAALERLLYGQPDWDSARLFYALTLYKLDDRQAAMRELDYLDGRPLSPQQRTQVNAYRNQFANNGTSKSKDDGFGGQFTLGARYDDNAGNALADSVFAFADEDDVSVFAQGVLKYSAPVGADSDLLFNASVNGTTRRHETFSAADYDAFGGHAGLSSAAGDWSWSANVRAMQVNISGSKYLTQIGPQLSISNSISENTVLTLSGAWYDQNYNNLNFTFTEPLRSGNKVMIKGALTHSSDDNSSVGASITFETKDAKNDIFAYDGFRINGHFFNGFDNGVYLKGRAGYRKLNYNAATVLVPGAGKRKDDHLSARFGLGASLNTIGTWMGMSPSENSQHMFLEGGLSYADRDSNIPTFKYNNFGTELKLIWKF